MIANVRPAEPKACRNKDVLDNITLYWLTNTAASSARLYWESKLPFFDPKERQAARRDQRLSR